MSQLVSKTKAVAITEHLKGGSPGLVVMGGGSCSKGHEFESRHRILDGHFFTYIFVVKFEVFV